jgi:hypothetical protein
VEGSTVRGSAQAIDRVQTSNVHSLQRPDSTHLTYDPTRTALDGQSGALGFSKISGTKTRFNVNSGYRSPGIRSQRPRLPVARRSDLARGMVSAPE